ncbi:hypothetical protein [Ruminococcus sp.]
MKTVVDIKVTAEQLITLLKQLSESQQAYISGYAQALADTKKTA